MVRSPAECPARQPPCRRFDGLEEPHLRLLEVDRREIALRRGSHKPVGFRVPGRLSACARQSGQRSNAHVVHPARQQPPTRVAVDHQGAAAPVARRPGRSDRRHRAARSAVHALDQPILIGHHRSLYASGVPALGLTVADATAGGGQFTAGQVRQTGHAAEFLERGHAKDGRLDRRRACAGGPTARRVPDAARRLRWRTHEIAPEASPAGPTSSVRVHRPGRRGSQGTGRRHETGRGRKPPCRTGPLTWSPTAVRESARDSGRPSRQASYSACRVRCSVRAAAHRLGRAGAPRRLALGVVRGRRVRRRSGASAAPAPDA